MMGAGDDSEPERDDIVGEVAIRAMEMRYARALLFGGARLDEMIAWLLLVRGITALPSPD